MENTRQEFMESLQHSAFLDVDNVYPRLCSLLGYRKSVAEMLLRGGSDDRVEALEELYEHSNEQIKRLLGIYK